jgi:ribosomal protein L12E/L44/L45/RPP1/RPP2
MKPVPFVRNESSKPTQAEPPSGMMMMLKALGIQIDPKMISTLASAVEEIRTRLERIETKLDAVTQTGGAHDGSDRGRKEATGSVEEKRG